MEFRHLESLPKSPGKGNNSPQQYSKQQKTLALAVNVSPETLEDIFAARNPAVAEARALRRLTHRRFVPRAGADETSAALAGERAVSGSLWTPAAAPIDAARRQQRSMSRFGAKCARVSE
jgi:hypothetical protein